MSIEPYMQNGANTNSNASIAEHCIGT